MDTPLLGPAISFGCVLIGLVLFEQSSLGVALGIHFIGPYYATLSAIILIGIGIISCWSFLDYTWMSYFTNNSQITEGEEVDTSSRAATTVTTGTSVPLQEKWRQQHTSSINYMDKKYYPMENRHRKRFTLVHYNNNHKQPSQQHHLKKTTQDELCHTSSTYEQQQQQQLLKTSNDNTKDTTFVQHWPKNHDYYRHSLLKDSGLAPSCSTLETIIPSYDTHYMSKYASQNTNNIQSIINDEEKTEITTQKDLFKSKHDMIADPGKKIFRLDQEKTDSVAMTTVSIEDDQQHQEDLKNGTKHAFNNAPTTSISSDGTDSLRVISLPCLTSNNTPPTALPHNGKNSFTSDLSMFSIHHPPYSVSLTEKLQSSRNQQQEQMLALSSSEVKTQLQNETTHNNNWLPSSSSSSLHQYDTHKTRTLDDRINTPNTGNRSFLTSSIFPATQQEMQQHSNISLAKNYSDVTSTMIQPDLQNNSNAIQDCKVLPSNWKQPQQSLSSSLYHSQDDEDSYHKHFQLDPCATITTNNLSFDETCIFYVPVNELIRYFSSPDKKDFLQAFYCKIIDNASRLTASVAADLLRLPVRVTQQHAAGSAATRHFEVILALCDRLLSIHYTERNLTSMQLALAAWSIAKSDMTSSKSANSSNKFQLLMSSLAEEALLHINEFQPLSIANFMWSCGKTRFKHPLLMSHLAEAAIAQIDQFNAQNIANTYWSLGTLEINNTALTPGMPSKQQPIYSNSTATIPSHTTLDIYNNRNDTSYETDSLYVALMAQLPTFNPQAIANFIWACGKLQWCRYRSLLLAAAHEGVTKIHSFKPQEAANFMWGIAKLGLTEAIPVVQLFAEYAAVHLHTFNSQEASNAYWTIGTLEIRDSALTPTDLSMPMTVCASRNSSTEDFSSSTIILNDGIQHCHQKEKGLDADDDSGLSLPSTTETLLQCNSFEDNYKHSNNKNAEIILNYNADAKNTATTQQGSKQCSENSRRLLSTLLNRMRQFNAQAIANLLWTCGKLQWKCPEVCDAACDIIAKNIRSFRPQNAANSFWAIAKLRYRNKFLIKLLVNSSMHHLPHFNTQELANVYWSLGTLEITGSPLTPTTEKDSTQTLNQWVSPTETSQINGQTQHCFSIKYINNGTEEEKDAMNALTSFSETNSMVCEVLHAKLRFFKPQEIANFLWACARLRWRNSAILDECTHVALRMVGRFKPQEVGNLVWGLAKLNFRRPELLITMCNEAAKNIHNYTAQNVANIYWALGSLSISQTALTRESPDPNFLKALITLIRKFNDQEVANFVWACSKLRWNNKDAISAASEVILRELKRYRKTDIVNLQNALRKLGCIGTDPHLEETLNEYRQKQSPFVVM